MVATSLGIGPGIQLKLVGCLRSNQEVAPGSSGYRTASWQDRRFAAATLLALDRSFRTIALTGLSPYRLTYMGKTAKIKVCCDTKSYSLYKKLFLFIEALVNLDLSSLGKRNCLRMIMQKRTIVKLPMKLDLCASVDKDDTPWSRLI
ncbi:MAG: hypothetical protein ACKO7W_10335 [Elainella sp.]